MAYVTITCLKLLDAICNLQSSYKKLQSLRAIVEFPCSSVILGDIEALTRLEAQITRLTYTTKDMDQLTRGESEVEVVSIVGMGGIGKTPLATKIYSDSLIMSRFDIHAKANVSQEYRASNVLLGLLSSISGKTDEFHEQQDGGQLADKLQKLLKNCNCGSRILLTTRNVEVARYASSGKPPYHMRLMNFDESWNLLHRKVFEKECSSPEFEKTGKQIALKCRGLPLAITVIAGLLSNVDKT
ncbi:hypothetical protein H5410_045556 [Solanum commersonii]|uniref:NB-ARC domain-containing protein n=1 Tax=Solanum commersonii TaxID=4109 RepID=A0A9J5XBG9_SOLCO|nr:hypothetical protein H5410_045556 [Solanum commersonii]